ncbi:hypothetical protein TB2_012857 [Malus domestica]
MGVGCLARAGWATRVGYSVGDTCECKAWVMALVPWALDVTTWAWAHASLDVTTRAVVAVPLTSPRVVVTVVTTAVVAMVEPRSDDAAPMITFSLVDRRDPIS